MPFSTELIAAAAAFSRAIFHDARAAAYPELHALAFWMRKAELARLAEEFARTAGNDTLLVPRGVVFHIPPANVDTIFIYSWLLSFLTGNRNLIRLSSRGAPQVEILCALLADILQKAPATVQESTRIVRYGHDDQITEAFSRLCDMRVIWGGDAAVNAIRRCPLPPHASELTFPDRYSLCAIRADAYLALGEAERSGVAERFVNDLFWFDQMACSSPRLLIWCGEPGDCEQAARTLLHHAAAVRARKSFVRSKPVELQKFTFACGAILDRPVTSYNNQDGLIVLELAKLDGFSREHCGGGVLLQVRVDRLDILIDYLDRRDQTLTYFGFEPADLRSFSARLNGSAIDRIVPIGEALQFHRFWDGRDLLQEFARRVHIPLRPAHVQNGRALSAR